MVLQQSKASQTQEFVMPRPSRLNLPGMPQHVVQRGNNRQACFHSRSDYLLYLSLLHRSSEKHNCQVHAYVLMPNHVHLLLTPDKGDGVSLLFRDMGRDYVRGFNKRYERTGTLWDGRFRSSLIENDKYLLACYRYIELNPVRAGIVKDPSSYEWSSFRANGLGRNNSLLTPHRTWMALGTDNADRRSRYLNLFTREVSDQVISRIRVGLAAGKPL
jgi:putative transposase